MSLEVMLVSLLLVAWVAEAVPLAPDDGSMDDRHRDFLHMLPVRCEQQPSCRQLGEADDDGPGSGSADSDYLVPGHCRLGVVVAGMPRSGSMFVYKLFGRITASILSMSAADRGSEVISLHWDEHRYYGLSGWGLATHLQQTKEVLLSIKEGDVVFARAHQYNLRLLDLCRRTVVVGVRRNPSEIGRSILISGWFNQSDMTAGVLSSFLVSSSSRHRCFASTPAFVDVDYADLDNLNRMTDHVKEFVEKAGLALNASSLSPVIREIWNSTAGMEANADHPSATDPSRARPLRVPQRMETAIQKSLRCPELASFMARHGYSPALDPSFLVSD